MADFWWIYLSKWVIFDSYVSLQDGTLHKVVPQFVRQVGITYRNGSLMGLVEI